MGVWSDALPILMRLCSYVPTKPFNTGRLQQVALSCKPITRILPETVAHTFSLKKDYVESAFVPHAINDRLFLCRLWLKNTACPQPKFNAFKR